MFSKNHIVSVRQMRRLLVLDLFAATGLVLPMAVGRLCGTAWDFCNSGRRCRGRCICRTFVEAGGTLPFRLSGFLPGNARRRAGQAVWAIYAIKYFVTAALLLGVFAQIINHTFLTDIPRAVLGMAMLLICIYSVFKGLETRQGSGKCLSMSLSYRLC